MQKLLKFTCLTMKFRNLHHANGRARAHARASNHGNGQYSSEAGASAAALKDGNKEGLIAESGAKGMNNRLSQIINSHCYLSYKALCLCLKGIHYA